MHRPLYLFLFVVLACSDGDATIDRSLRCSEQATERFKRDCFAQELPRFEVVLRYYSDTIAKLEAAPDSVRAAQQAWLEMRARDCGITSDSVTTAGVGDLDVLECVSVRDRQRLTKQSLALKAFAAP